MHSTPALPQGLVPPGQGSKVGAEQTPAGQNWERSRSSEPRAPTAPRAAPSQHLVLTLTVSFLRKQLNKLFGDRQAQVWVQWRWGQR